MNFLTVKVAEKGGSVVLEEGTFEIKPAAEHQEYLKKYVGKEVYFGIRPEDLSYVEKSAGDNNIPVKITVVEPLGADIHLWLTTNTQPLVARTEPHHTFKVGDTANFTPRLDKARYFDKETELSILPSPDAGKA
jgi:multiple sugar transport system ATP-binding protein